MAPAVQIKVLYWARFVGPSSEKEGRIWRQLPLSATVVLSPTFPSIFSLHPNPI